MSKETLTLICFFVSCLTTIYSFYSFFKYFFEYCFIDYSNDYYDDQYENVISKLLYSKAVVCLGLLIVSVMLFFII